MSTSTQSARATRWLLTLPPIGWVTAFLLVPYGVLFLYSLWRLGPFQTIVHTFSTSNYSTLFQNPLYSIVLLRSLRIAGAVTALSLFLSYPLAYALSFHAGNRKEILYQLVIIPLWVSYLVRAYAWKTILGSDGVLNGFLQYTHVAHRPLEIFLYSSFAVILTLTHIYTPFVFISIYAALEQLPHQLMEASSDLGASRFETFWRVIVPLSFPGVLAGATFAFVLSFGDFIAPLLLGGASGVMVSNIVVSLFGAAYDWPLGSAIGFTMLLSVLVLLGVVHRLERRWRYV